MDSALTAAAISLFDNAASTTEMTQVLDRLIFYLRVVHSVDFYAPALYLHEDAMPHPCHIMHVRLNPAEVRASAAAAAMVPRQQQRMKNTVTPSQSSDPARVRIGSMMSMVIV